MNALVSREQLIRYRNRRLEDLSRIAKALDTNDYGAIREVGHRIKGNAALYGLADLGEVARDMEEAAQAADDLRLLRCIDRFRSEVDQIVRSEASLM